MLFISNKIIYCTINILTHYNKIVDLINKYPTVMGTNTKLTHIPEEMLNSKN